MGGKGPVIVTSDVEIDEAVGYAYQAMFTNAGQICVAGSRLIIPEQIYDKFVKKLVDKAKKTAIGDPFDYGTRMGPMISSSYMEKVLSYIEIGG